MDNTAEAAAIAQDHWRLAGQGLLLCQPPPEDAALPAAEVEGWVEQALRKAAAQGIQGTSVTPYLLAEIRQLSNGRTLTVNRALALSNAALGAALAGALAGHAN